MNLKDATVTCWPIYIWYSVSISIIIRFAISGLKVLEYSYISLKDADQKMRYFKSRGKWGQFGLIFNGFEKIDPFPDFWYNTFLGFLELLAFPLLIRTEQYGIVGAWIGFKSLAQWNAWNKNRYVFNRFLIAHAVIIIICFLWLQNSISLKH